MRIEIVIFGITAFLIFNTYTDGKYVKMLPQFKKYYQMAAIAAGGFVLYYLIKKNPLSAGAMLSTTQDYLKYMPIDRNSSKIINPILDFTSKQTYNDDQTQYGGSVPVLPVQHISSEQKIMNSGKVQPGQRMKRSVSETKKKFVASRQGWKCGECQDQLNAWFEVDHKIRLEHGGSNHVDNLVALCRECHGKKTTIENL
jgi:5-methylcytosine-specific restriction endonuclease McrA